MFRRKKKEVVQEPLPEGAATAEIVIRKREGMFTPKYYEFYAQVISGRGFEERHAVRYTHGIGFEDAIYSDVIEGGGFKHAYQTQVREEVQKKVLNTITQALVAEGFKPTHARGQHWFSIRFEKN